MINNILKKEDWLIIYSHNTDPKQPIELKTEAYCRSTFRRSKCVHMPFKGPITPLETVEAELEM